MGLFSWVPNLLKWFGRIFKKGADTVNDLLPKVIDLVNNIKEFDTANPDVADFFTKIIPGDWDDNLKDKARDILPEVLTQFQGAQACMQLPTQEEQLTCIIKQLQSITNNNVQALFWGDLAALITHALADGKLSIEEIRSVVKFIYDKNHEDEED